MLTVQSQEDHEIYTKSWLTSHCQDKRILVIGPFDPEYGSSGSKIRVRGVSSILCKYASSVDYVGLDDGKRGRGVWDEKTEIYSRKTLVEIRSNIFTMGAGLLFGKSYRRAKFQNKDLRKYLKSVVDMYDLIWVNFLDGMQYLGDSKGDFEIAIDLHNNDLEWYLHLHQAGASFVRRFIAKRSVHAINREMQHGFNVADFIVCVSGNDADALGAAFKESKFSLKSIILPNCIDEDKFALTCGDSANRLFDLGFIGSLAVDMNHDAAMFIMDKILPPIIHAHPGVKLVIAGANPRSELRKKMNSMRDNVTLLPNVHDIDEIYRQIKIFLMPFDKGGGTKLKYLEAAAARCLVLSTRLGVQGFNVNFGRDYICCDSAKDFSDAVGLMILPGEKMRRVVESNYITCRSKYCWESYYPGIA